jgi:hypothetical protein
MGPRLDRVVLALIADKYDSLDSEFRSTPSSRAAFRSSFALDVATRLDSSTIQISGPTREGRGFSTRLAMVRALMPALRKAFTLPLAIPRPRTV